MWSPTIKGDDAPSPTFAVQSGLASIHCLPSQPDFSALLPFRLGPRQCGQSSAKRAGARSNQQASKLNLNIGPSRHKALDAARSVTESAHSFGHTGMDA